MAWSSWFPTCSDSEAGVPAHHLLSAGYRSHQLGRLPGQEATHYRHNTIVSTHRVIVEHERSQPQGADGYETAAKVTDYYASARDTIHFGDEVSGIIITKMMHYLGAHYDVYA